MYQPIGIKNPPLSPIFSKYWRYVLIVWNFRSNLSSSSYCFPENIIKKIRLRRKIYTFVPLYTPQNFTFHPKAYFFRLRRKVSSVCSQNPPNPSKIFRLWRKMDNFLSLRSYFLKIFKFKFLLFEIFFQFLKSKFLTRGGS